MKNWLLIVVFLLSAASETSAVRFVKADGVASIETLLEEDPGSDEYKNDRDETIFIPNKRDSSSLLIKYNTIFISNKHDSSSLLIEYRNKKFERIRPNKDSSHWKNCFPACLSMDDARRIAVLSVKENIFYEQALEDLVAHKKIIESEYKDLMEKELYTIKNAINDEWSRMSLLERLVNYFAINKKRKKLDEDCRKQYGASSEYKKNLEAIEGEIQSFTNPVNRESLTRSWMNDKDFEDLQDARNYWTQNIE